MTQRPPMTNRQATYVVLAFFALVFVIKFLILNAYTFPPSEDGPGDIQHAHEWMALNLGGDINALPPLYYLLEVIPLLWALGSPFLVLKVIMALAPSLLIPATYLAARKFHASTFSCILAALLMGMSTVFANMSTWNSGFDLFGILFMIPAIGYYYEAFETKAKRPILLGAVFTALTAGSHQLAFFTLLLTLSGFGLLSVAREFSWKALRTYMSLTSLSAIFSFPFAPFYLNAVHTSVGVGFSPSTIGSWWTVAEQAVFTAWGINANIGAAVDFVWVVVFAVILARYDRGAPGADQDVAMRENRRFLLLMGVLFAVALGGVAYNSENWIRSFFFEAIPSVFIFAKGFSAFLRLMPTKNYRMLGFIFVLMTVVGNFAYSSYSFDAGIQYYSFFCTIDNDCSQPLNNYTRTLDFMQAHTIPAKENATVYSTFMVTWIEAVTGDTGIGTYNLQGRLTSYSFQSSLAAAMIYFGLYDIGNGVFNVGINGPTQNTTVYVSYGGFWQPAVAFNPATIVVMNGAVPHRLSEAKLTGVVGQVDSNQSVLARMTWAWPDGFIANEEIDVNQDLLSMTFLGHQCQCKPQVVTIHERNRLFAGSTAQGGGPSTGWTYSVQQGGNTFRIAGYENNGTLETDVGFAVGGNTLTPNVASAYFVDSAALIRDFRIQYFVISSKYDATLYDNLLSQPGYQTVFQSADVVVVQNADP